MFAGIYSDALKGGHNERTLEKLWDEYLLDKCALIDTDEEKDLTKKAVELHEKANSLLSEEQKETVEKYVDTLCEIETILVKKAFFKGCEFSVSFILEAGIFENNK